MLTGKYRQGEKGRAEGMGGRVFQAEDSPRRTATLDAVLAIAAARGARPDQVAIAWAGTHGAVPMIGPRTLSQLRSNLGAVTLDLAPEEIARLDAVSALDAAATARTPRPWAAPGGRAVA